MRNIRASKDANFLADCWPCDISTLQKGDVISADRLVPFLDAEFGSQAYQLNLANFASALERALWAISKPFVVRCRQGSVAILTDIEAAFYTRGRFNAHYRGLHRSNSRAKAVDQKKLDAGDRRRHEHALVVQGAMIASASKAREEVQPTVYRRRNPGAEAFARDAT